jgi:DNA-binding transcriptional LysR family regulator
VNLNLLKTFIVVSKHLNFTKAALELRVAQPAVTKSIKKLEEELEIELFLRSNKSVLLTKRGHELLKKISPLINGISETIEDLKNESKNIAGEIRVGTLLELGEFLINPIVISFRKKNPEIKIEVVNSGNKELIGLLNRGDVDFIFGLSPVISESDRSYKFARQNSFLVTSKHTDLKQKHNFVDEKFIAYRKDDPLIKTFFKKFYPKYSLLNLKYSYISNSHKSMIDILKVSPNTFSVLPEFSASVDEALKSKEIKVVNKYSLVSDIYFSYKESDYIPKKDQLFIDHIKKNRKI